MGGEARRHLGESHLWWDTGAADRGDGSHRSWEAWARGHGDCMRPGQQGHEFKNAKADEGSGPGGSSAAALCDNVRAAWGAGRGSFAAVLASTGWGQATSSMPANSELQPLLAAGLHRQSLGPGPSSGSPFGVSVSDGSCSDPGPCFLAPASLVSAFLVPPETVSRVPSEGGGSAGLGCSPDGGAVPLGRNRVELRGCRNAWSPVKGTESVSRSEGPMRAAAGLGSASSLWAGGCCRQDASKCLRIWMMEKGTRRGVLCSPKPLGHPPTPPSREQGPPQVSVIATRPTAHMGPHHSRVVCSPTCCHTNGCFPVIQ